MTEVNPNALFTELTEAESSVLNGGTRFRRRICRVTFVRVCRRYGWFVRCAFVRQTRCFFA